MEQSFVLNLAKAWVMQEITEHETSRLGCCRQLGLFLIFSLVCSIRLVGVILDFSFPSNGVLTCLLIQLAFHQHVEEVRD